MARPCERCKRIRYQITLVFGVMILINFVIRSALNFDTKTIYDLLLVPSSLILVFSVFVLCFSRRRIK